VETATLDTKSNGIPLIKRKISKD